MDSSRIRECLYLILNQEDCVQWYSPSVLLLTAQDPEDLFFGGNSSSHSCVTSHLPSVSL